jgi:predicted tellurium resistance membrane protein TerC
MDHLLTSEGLLALVTLAAMEIVLGVDNLVFIAILSARLPAAQQLAARRTGLAAALVTRVGLLFAISWMMGLTAPFLSFLGHAVSGRDLILLLGGLFLMFKATREIYDKVEAAHTDDRQQGGRLGVSFAMVVGQIMLLDIVFSLDSVITAVGMAEQLAIMVIAMVIAMVVMLFSMEGVSGFIERHPSLKILALSFLLLIGVMLVAEGMGRHVPKGYIYFAMAFSLMVELLNMRYRKKADGLGRGGDRAGRSAS